MNSTVATTEHVPYDVGLYGDYHVDYDRITADARRLLCCPECHAELKKELDDLREDITERTKPIKRGCKTVIPRVGPLANQNMRIYNAKLKVYNQRRLSGPEDVAIFEGGPGTYPPK